MQHLIRVLVALTCIWSLNAMAHTRLSASTPAAGVTVDTPVASIVLEFGSDVRLTAVTLKSAAGSAKTLGPLPSSVAGRFVIDVREELAPGDYVITWRCVGSDTHIVSGDIAFTVAGAGPI